MFRFNALFPVAVFAVLLVAACFCGSISRADTQSTQPYQSARYALIGGPVLVRAADTSQVVRQDVMMKFDTQTGQAWILQMTVRNDNDPTILKADFVPAGNLHSAGGPEGFGNF